MLGADNASPSGGKNVTTAELQSGLWFGKTDDLWGFGRPSGWRSQADVVRADEPSDPYLMTGFQEKCLHVENHGEDAAVVDLEVECTATESPQRKARSRAGRAHHSCLPQRVQRPLGQSGQRHGHHGIRTAVLHLSSASATHPREHP